MIAVYAAYGSLFKRENFIITIIIRMNIYLLRYIGTYTNSISYREILIYEKVNTVTCRGSIAACMDIFQIRT